MNFLGLGPGELVLIAVLGLIVFGPGKLPEIARQVGKGVRDFRQSTAEINAEFQRSFSLEGSPPPPNPAGPAAVFATNGAASEVGGQGTQVPPEHLADTSEWHWESSGSDQPAVSAATDQPATGSFWDWDSQQAKPDEPPSSVGVDQTQSGWQWDSPESSASSGGEDSVQVAGPADTAPPTMARRSRKRQVE